MHWPQVEDLMAAGVIDPAKVTRNGLLNSCSIAGIMLTTQVCIFCFLPRRAPGSHRFTCVCRTLQAVMVERKKGDAKALGFNKAGMPSGLTV
jgi:hypothetical protein